MKKKIWTRCLSLLLAACMVFGMAPVVAHASPAASDVQFEEISPEEVTADLRMDEAQANSQTQETEGHDPDEIVRVSIVLEKAPVLDRGYSAKGLSTNSVAQAYRETLLEDQQAVTKRISNAIGGNLDVAWNLTLAANIISVNVCYGDLEKIAATRGVSEVVLETRYEPCEAEESTAQPNNGTATVMTGASTAWAAGYTGAGSRIAIIDTGLDTDHEAVDNGAYLYALTDNAKAAGMSTEDYMASLNLLDAEEIAAVLPQLNIYKGYNDIDGVFKKDNTLTADALHLNDKIAFAYNYIDRDLDVTHDNDSMGAHGSHVAGIAAANRYVAEGEDYVPSMESTFVVGTAPDAQLIIMKVFGKAGGAYDSDYMAAIEDAILLDCDVVNLSLGSTVPGFTVSDTYQRIMDKLTETDLVVSVSSGNSYAWPEYSANGYLYAEDVNYHTGGMPGSYDNSFTVASVNNAGMTGYSFQAAGRDIVYTETGTINKKLASMDTSADGSGTEYEYIFLDKLGYPEDFQGLDLTGKVVIFSRGELSFSQKLTNADAAGAAAAIIYNNESGGAISMDLSQSGARIACVGIAKNDADAIRAASETVTDGEGNPLYYTGKLTIGHERCTSIDLSQDCVYTMSDFSSWGVTSDLTLKPEITAPGGSIYSINGATAKTDQYTYMSGTSMAAPHNAGLVALLCQYFRETGLPEEAGVSPRVLSQSLLMSTATPIVDASSGLPYPVIQQGAGLGNINDAMNAASYVMVEGQPDGKVKAELGDDPDRTGVYTFDYTLYNLLDEAQRYTLSADVYTQNALQDEDGAWCADYMLTELEAQTTYTVNGREILPEAGELIGCDFNGDGKIDEADGQALLDYAVGKSDSLTNMDNADLSGDGKLTAYDAELFLSRLGSRTVELPAGGEVTVTVTITLSESAKQELDKIYVNGAYIEAYVYAAPLATEEGVLSATHSIPVLSFYGSWDEAPMFDRVTHTELSVGTNERTSYIPASMFFESDYNYVGVSLAETPDYDYYLGGNPYAEDEEYLPERNAIRSGAGDAVTGLNFCLIRAAGALRSAITNVETGEQYAYEEFTRVFPAFFFSNNGTWQNYSQSVVPGAAEGEDWMVTDNQGNPLPEDTTVELMVQAAPEYYLNGDNTVNWDEIDSTNTTLSMPVTVDNTAPVLKSVSVGTETDPVTGESYDFVEAVAQDNRYVAAVLITTPGGTKVIGRQSPNQQELGVEARVRVNVTGVFGTTFKLAVVDYAGNATYYKVNVSEPFSGPTATLYCASGAFKAAQWLRFTSDTNYDYEVVKDTSTSIAGAAYGDGYLFYTSTAPGTHDSQYYLYVLDYPSFDDPIQIGPVSGSPSYMTYNTSDGYLYYVSNGGLRRLDVTDASETLVASINNGRYRITGLSWSQEEQCFYAIAYIWKYDSTLGKPQNPMGIFRFSLPEEDGESITPEQVADLGIWECAARDFILDEEQNAAYFVVPRTDYCEIMTYQFDTGALTLTGRFETPFGVFMPDDATANDNRVSRDTPTSVSLNQTSMNLFVGSQKQLSAEVKPWCLLNKEISWSSSDPTVATVDETGAVTGIKDGIVTITAASVVDNSILATCEVAVIGSSFTLQAVGNQDGSSSLVTIDLETGVVSDGVPLVNEEGEALPVESAAEDSQGVVWVQDSMANENGIGYRMYTIDEATGKATFTTQPNTNKRSSESLLFTDIAVDDYQDVIMAVNGENAMYFSADPSANDAGSSWFSSFDGNLVGIAAGGNGVISNMPYTRFYLLCDTGEIITCDLSENPYLGWGIMMNYYDLDKDLTFTTDENGLYQDSFIYNTQTNVLLLSHYSGQGSTEIYAIDLIEDAGGGRGRANVGFLGEITGFDSLALYDADFEGLAVASTEPVVSQGRQILLTVGQETLPQGTTNAVADAPEKDDDGIVTVTLRAEEAAASGMLEIALDESMTLVGMESPVTLSSYVEKDGKVTFAYADYDAVAKGEVIAVLRLKDVSEPATLTVTETERGGKTPESKPVTVELGHARGETETREIPAHSDNCPSKNFTDLDTTKWYHEYIDFVLDAGIMLGVGGSKFAPNGTMTRAMLVTVLYRLAGEPEVKTAAPFTDVPEDQWYADAVAWAYENKIALGVTETRFAPDEPATREQLVTLLYRYAQVAGMDTSATADLTAFADGNTVSAYAVDAMAWAVGAGLVKGTDRNRLAPAETATRAQLAALIFRLVK